MKLAKKLRGTKKEGKNVNIARFLYMRWIIARIYGLYLAPSETMLDLIYETDVTFIT